VFTEDEFIQIGALQHYVFCPRQCALIHIEDAWQENVFTVRGDILHEKVDSDTYEARGTLKTVRGLRIHSFRLGIVGRADVVEFRRSREGTSGEGVLPVEFKSGHPKGDISDKVQLCAQVLCLEEMLDTRITRGAFFYGRIRRRVLIDVDNSLRSQTESIITSVHELVSKKTVPPARYMEKCRHCSLESICMPKAMNERKLRQYMKGLYAS
jgi:CRISPR-associated exonuclease Cas4